jgi:type IV pilus assembly protein PilW
MPLAIQAYDGGASVPSDLSGCLPAADYKANTDILVVRRASTTRLCPTGKTCCAAAPVAPYTVSCVPTMPTATVTAAPYGNQPFIQTTAAAYLLGTGANLATFTLTRPSGNTTTTLDAPLRRYIVRIYFVSVCNVPASGTTCNGTTDDGGTPIPTLKMLELGVNPLTNAGPQFNKLAVAEGIEHLQFDFGVDTTGDGVADTIRQCDSTTPCTAIDFSNVVTVQVNIVARNTETSPSFVDDKTYSLGLKGYTTATNDHYRRHSYSSLVRMNNIAQRRE